MSTMNMIRRAALMLSFVALPILAMPAVNAGTGLTIEAPASKNSGAGLVLMVSIQRAQ